jgi:glycogen debranching enzyme
MLSGERARRVVAVVERQLLTPFGLRSLAPGDAQYRPVYRGDAYSRDTAYHQGTVWAWLMGPFITAYVKVNRRSKKSRQVGRTLLEGFGEHLREAGLGTVSEIFDAEAPHRPGGCIAQAWSVAELLRAACEEVFDYQQRAGRLEVAASSVRVAP